MLLVKPMISTTVISAVDIWPPVWSQITDLDEFTYHVGLPLLFCLLALLATVLGRVVFFTAGTDPNNSTDSNQNAVKQSLWLGK